jgi:hypothetical protein
LIRLKSGVAVGLAVVRAHARCVPLLVRKSIERFETDVVAGFVLVRATAGLSDRTIRGDVSHLQQVRSWFGRPSWDMQPGMQMPTSAILEVVSRKWVTTLVCVDESLSRSKSPSPKLCSPKTCLMLPTTQPAPSWASRGGHRPTVQPSHTPRTRPASRPFLGWPHGKRSATPANLHANSTTSQRPWVGISPPTGSLTRTHLTATDQHLSRHDFSRYRAPLWSPA